VDFPLPLGGIFLPGARHRGAGRTAPPVSPPHHPHEHTRATPTGAARLAGTREEHGDQACGREPHGAEVPGRSRATVRSSGSSNSAARRRAEQAARRKTGSPHGSGRENARVGAREPRAQHAFGPRRPRLTTPPDRALDLYVAPRRAEPQAVTDNLKPAKSSGLPTSAHGAHHLPTPYLQAH
jgi:hypothetical protein